MTLDEVREAAAKAASARREMEWAVMRAAREHSLRDVGQAAGISHEQVRRIADVIGRSRR